MNGPPDPDEGPRDIWFVVFLAVALEVLLAAVVVALAIQ